MASELKLSDILTGPYTWKSLQPCDLSNCTREQILEYFENTYSLNESIFAALKYRDVFYTAPDRLRLPLIFYYAHTAVVYVNKLMLAGLLEERVNYEFETMFETGVDEMSWDDTENFRMGGSYKWPELEDVLAFRLKVRNIIRKIIQETPLELPITQESPWWAVFMGFEHERIHLETSSVLIRQLPITMVRRPEGWLPGPHTFGESPSKNPMIEVNEAEVTLGKPHDFPSYGWDNEYPTLEARVPRFEASKYLISNREFLEFVRAGGYKEKELWSKEGWQWRTYRQAVHPTFWVCNQGCKSGCGGVIAGHSHCKLDQNENGCMDTEEKSMYRYRMFCEETAMPWDWPVEVNYHEAKAYACWRGPEYRLPTEAEHHAMRESESSPTLGAQSDLIYHSDLHKKYNINMVYGSSTPVHMYPPTKRGFHDVFGNVWQWHEDHFNGFPGSKSHFLYDDFSTPTFDGKHNLILGGSWISTGDEASRFARYAFRRHFFQHAGFRLARSIGPIKDLPVRLVETVGGDEQEVSLPIPNVAAKQYPSTNGQLQEEVPSYMDERLFEEHALEDNNLSSVLARISVDAARRHGANLGRMLDLGCGCGRLSFELSQHYDEIIASDYCGIYVKAAEEILKKKQKMYLCPKDDCQRPVKRAKKKMNGHDGCQLTAHLPPGTEASKITLKQFTWVPNELTDFDLVVHHFLDRVGNKKAWLVRLDQLLTPTGLVIISAKGGWKRERLEPIIGKKLEFIESIPVVYNSDHGSQGLINSETSVSIWRLKNRDAPRDTRTNGTD